MFMPSEVLAVDLHLEILHERRSVFFRVVAINADLQSFTKRHGSHP
jgi:hypothetical protein